MTEANARAQLTQGCHLEADRPRFKPATFWVVSERCTIMSLVTRMHSHFSTRFIAGREHIADHNSHIVTELSLSKMAGSPMLELTQVKPGLFYNREPLGLIVTITFSFSLTSLLFCPRLGKIPSTGNFSNQMILTTAKQKQESNEWNR